MCSIHGCTAHGSMIVRQAASLRSKLYELARPATSRAAVSLALVKRAAAKYWNSW